MYNGNHKQNNLSGYVKIYSQSQGERLPALCSGGKEKGIMTIFEVFMAFVLAFAMIQILGINER